MLPDAAKLAGSTQEQAVAALVDHLNQLRLDGLLSALGRQDENLRDALGHVQEAMATIDLEVVARNRGGTKGMHGFIAEVAEVGKPAPTSRRSMINRSSRSRTSAAPAKRLSNGPPPGSVPVTTDAYEPAASEVCSASTISSTSSGARTVNAVTRATGAASASSSVSGTRTSIAQRSTLNDG